MADKYRRARAVACISKSAIGFPCGRHLCIPAPASLGAATLFPCGTLRRAAVLALF